MSETILTGQQQWQWEKYRDAALCVENGQILTRAQFTALMDMAGEGAGRPIDGINEGEAAYNATLDALDAALEALRQIVEDADRTQRAYETGGGGPALDWGVNFRVQETADIARAALAAVATPQGQEVTREDR
jgi:hypothetical protein